MGTQKIVIEVITEADEPTQARIAQFCKQISHHLKDRIDTVGLDGHEIMPDVVVIRPTGLRCKNFTVEVSEVMGPDPEHRRVLAAWTDGE